MTVGPTFTNPCGLLVQPVLRLTTHVVPTGVGYILHFSGD